MPKIEFEKYTLANGLSLILHQDSAIPMVAVNIWYHVGSKNEQRGRTGFAHLFEHIMFKGSEHHNAEYMEPLEKIGASVNGSTSEDRTNYYENLPSNYLELALWLESDRLGYLLPMITQEHLDAEREVVKNERRESIENEPYGKAEELLLSLLYPDHHPYSWPIIGSMEDLASASVEDIANFFQTYYTPNNASLCIAGDFDSRLVKDWVANYFGTIPPGPAIDRMAAWMPEISSQKRMVAEDRVHLPRLYYAWHTPALFESGDAEFDLFAEILTAGKTSRLFKSLVYEQQIAQDISAHQASQELGSIFSIVVTVKKDHTLAEVEEALDKELTKIFSDGILSDELEQAKSVWLTQLIRRMGRLGARADLLNEYNVMLKDPDRLEWDVQRYLHGSVDDLHYFSKKYLDFNKSVVLHIVPQKELSVLTTGIPDRSAMPASLPEPVFIAPRIQKNTLSNGLELWLVEDHRLPLVQMSLIIKSGWANDPVDRPGTAALTAELIDEGTRSRDALRISEDTRRLGASLGSRSFFDGSFITLNLLKKNLAPGLSLMSDLILEPTFPEQELDRQRQIYLGRIHQESKQPFTTALKIFLRKLYGEHHPYGQPYTGSGTVASIKAIQRMDLLQYYQSNYFSNNSVIVMVGDVTLSEARSSLNKLLGSWNQGQISWNEIAQPSVYKTTTIFIADQPGASQSVVVVGCLGIRRNDPDYLAFEVMNNALGGQYTSRINMNLREDKGYTYGAETFTMDTRAPGPFICFSSVYTEHTSESIFEIVKELRLVIGERPLSNLEVADSKNNLIKSFPQGFQTYNAIASQMTEMIIFDLPADEWKSYATRVSAVDGHAASRIARKIIDPERLLIVVVGDREKIISGIRDLNLGEIHFVNDDAVL